MTVRKEVQAVIFDEVDKIKKVLLLKKADYSTRRYRWRLLKGGVHDGETETEALEREVLEETGLRKIKIMSNVHAYEFIFRGVKHVVFSYLVKADSSEPITLQKSEVAGYMWTTSKEALQMLHWNNERDALSRLR